MHTIIPAVPENAEVIHDIQMRAFAEEGRMSESLEIPPLTEDIAAIALHIRTQTVLIARDGERIIGSARGIVEGAVCTIRGVSVEPSYQPRNGSWTGVSHRDTVPFGDISVRFSSRSGKASFANSDDAGLILQGEATPPERLKNVQSHP